MKRAIPILRYLISVQASALFFLFLIRIIFYGSNLDKVNSIESNVSLLSRAMLKGVQFDNVIACYILALPLVILPLLSIRGQWIKPAVKTINIYFIFSYTVVFGFAIANIPYFKYSFTHIGASVLQWLQFGQDTVGMIFQERSYILYFILFFVLVTLFGLWINFLGKKVTHQWKETDKHRYSIFIPVLVLLWGACFIGIRGTLERYPIRTGAAYFSSNAFYNQLGLNPMFYFMKSYSSYKKNINYLEGILSPEEAIGNVQHLLRVPSPETEGLPISRLVTSEKEPAPMNVVVILMESFSSELLNRTYQGKPLTPYMHELINNSYYFENIYSAGIHTNNGIVGTLYGYPAQFSRHMMPADIVHYTGLPTVLQDHGYETLFFVTGNPQYDNMNFFLRENGIQEIYSLYDYPSDKVVNNFGVQDGYMFEYGIDVLNRLSKKENPFLSIFLTVSNHPPFIVPDEFKDKGSDDSEAIVAYADDCIRVFMESARKESWYENTLFVFIGDHGSVHGEQNYPMALSYNHVPLIFHSSRLDDAPRVFNQYGLQIDVYPSVMELLGYSYVNNSLGESLFSHQRPFSYFVSDTHLGCINEELFYLFNPGSGEEGLYRYKEGSTENLITLHSDIAKEMKEYGTSMLIAADHISSKGWNSSENP